MSRFNTGNPLDSDRLEDLSDNAKNVDLFSNDTKNKSYTDRFGKKRRTIHSMESDFDADQKYRSDKFSEDQADRESQFIASQKDKQDRFNDFIASSGYQYVGDYAAGVELTEYNQVVRDVDGEFWRVSGKTELPYTLTGAGADEGGALVSVGDANLRQDLANPDKGAAMVARPVSSADFFALTGIVEGLRYSSEDGMAWEVVPQGLGWFDHPNSPVGLIPVLVDGALYIEQLPAIQDMTSLLNNVLSRATRASPMALRCFPGLTIPINERLHIPPYTSVDLGDHSTGGRFSLGEDGWITQDGRSHVTATVTATTPVRNNPAYVFSTDYITASPALAHFDTSFDLAIIGSWQDEAESLRIESKSSSGYAWVRGKADIREFHYGPTLETKADGYLNSLALDFRVYGAVEFYREINGGREIAANQITLDAQPGRPVGKPLAQRVVQSQAKRSIYHLNVWDWNSNTDGNLPSVLFDVGSEYNRMYANISGGAFSSPAVVDLGLGNRVEQHIGRINNPPREHLPISETLARGDFTDVLLGAYSRFPVTLTGATATTEYRAFEQGSGYMHLHEFTSATIEVDLTGASIAKVHGLEVSFPSSYIPDNFQVHTSTDGGATWDLRLESVPGMPQQLNQRFDDRGFSGAVDRVRLTMTNSTPKLVRLFRFAMHATTGGVFVPYGVMMSASPRAFGRLDVRDRVGNHGFTGTAGVLINGSLAFTSLGGPRPVNDNATSVGTAALRYSEVYARNGSIITSDARAKAQISTIPDEWLNAWGDVEWTRFKMAEAVAEKGDQARWHVGLVAQQIIEAFAARGLDAMEIGIVCYERWDDIWSVEDDPSERRLIKPAGDLYAVRYDEAQALEAAWIRRQISLMA